MDFAGVDERIRVVVVDDVVDHADGLAARLEREGFDTRAVYAAAEFLALRQTFKPHCVLFDIVMPGIDGLDYGSWLSP